MVLGAWCLVLGAWRLALGAWCLALGAWCLVLGGAAAGGPAALPLSLASRGRECRRLVGAPGASLGWEMAAKKTRNQARSTKNEPRFGSAFGEMAAGGPAALPLRCLTEPSPGRPPHPAGFSLRVPVGVGMMGDDVFFRIPFFGSAFGRRPDPGGGCLSGGCGGACHRKGGLSAGAGAAGGDA